jgi:hypothetical protein
VRGHFLETATATCGCSSPTARRRASTSPPGKGKLKLVARRAVLFELNALHLNNLKGAWTYVADAVRGRAHLPGLTGMTMMKGDRGCSGRGKYFVGAGLAVPVGFIAYAFA